MMVLRNIRNYGLLGLLVLVPYFVVAGVAKADTIGPPPASNVTVSSTPNGYQVTIADKPGYDTEVTVTCTASGCKNSSTSVPIAAAGEQSMESAVHFPQEQALENLIQAQEAFFQQQEQILQSLWPAPGSA